jgi:tetratricopeptide (TPR) repeat protein
MPNEMKSAEEIMETSPDSALHILQHMQSVNTMSDADRALYGLLYFQALDKNNKPLQPDSLISFSLNYYLNQNDNNRLASSYYYKARALKLTQRYDDATMLYLKSLDIVQNSKNYDLLGKIYSDMGDICSIQMDYNQALEKYNQSIICFNKAGDTTESCYRVIYTGRIHRFLKNYKKAQLYYKKALSLTSDSLIHGAAFQEMGINYYKAERYDSAQYFLRKSLCFPYKGTNYAIRCYNLAELFFDREQYDSAFQYANLALKYPSNFFNQRDCYRILANTEYSRKDYKQMGFYMTKYQACTDSVRKVEIQTKSTVLESLYETNGTASKTQKYLLLLACVITLIIILSFLIVFRLRNRNIGKDKQLVQVEEKLSSKQLLLKESLAQKIQETRSLQLTIYKKASLKEREAMDKELYNICLHVNDWLVFKKLMDQVFNNIITNLELKYNDINHKEMIWCCLFLLDVPTPDIALVLDSQPGSIYKLKQRLAQKMNLSNMKEFDKLLKDLSEGI